MPRKPNQKLKMIYIADFLMNETDTDDKGNMLHGVYLYEIRDYLKGKGIEADEHAIRRDIDLLCGGKDKTFDAVLNVCGGKGKPIYLGTRYLPFNDLEAIIECVASASFISENEANDLIEKLKRFCSRHQAAALTNEYIIVKRPAYTQKKTLRFLRTIRSAIRMKRKISFLYTRHNRQNIVAEPERRRQGQRYIVSPFRVALSDGHHYLIGYDDTHQEVRAYRIDRMDGVNLLKSPIEGEEQFRRLGVSDYAKQTFGMFFGGEANRITMLFDDTLLDAMLERFPKGDGTNYKRVDDTHYTIETFIVESENFYGWVCGLGEKVLITEPAEAADRFKSYLQTISAKYC